MKKPIRILIVEDKADDADLAMYEIRRVLNDCEFQVVETRENFLKALEVFQPDVILSDYGLPQFDGMKALNLALHQAPFTPLIIWTGSISEDVAVDCVKAGANNYILKDNLMRLGPAVLRALEERELLIARKQAEQKYQNIFENSVEGIFQSSPQGRYLNLNPSMARIHKYASPQEMIDAIQDISTQIYVEPSKRSEFMNLLNSQNSVEHFETRNYCKDGSIIWTSTSARAVRDSKGSILYFEGFVQDITQRKVAEEALQSNEKRFRALIENGLDDISLLDAEGALLWESPSTVRNLGYEPNEFVGRNIFQIMHPDDQKWVGKLFAKLIGEPGNRQSGAFRLRRSDGSWRWVESIATNLLGEPGINAVVINYRDVTEQKQAEIELQQRNNDLTLINGLNEVINRGADLGPVMDLLRNELKRVFSSEYANIYLLDQAGESLKLHQSSIPAGIAGKVEKLIGRSIPKIEIPVQKDGLFQSVLRSGRSMVTSDPDVLQKWIGEFVETASLSPLAKGTIRKLLPQIYKILNIKSTILVPLISDGKTLGVMNVSGPVIFTEQDFKRIENICGQLTIALYRKRVEEMLKEERNLLRTLIDHLPDRIYAMDAQGRKTLSNTADWMACGANTMEDVIGKTEFDTYPPELAAEFWRLDRAVLDSGHPVINFEEPGLHPDGNLVSILTTKIPLRDNEGRVLGLVGIGRDITERKQTEARINDLLAFNEKILTHSPMGILTYKFTGECVFTNDNAASIAGTSVELLKSLNFHSLESWKKSGFYNLVQKAMDTLSPVTADIHHTSIFGKEVWLTVHCTTFKLKGEDHLLIFLTDITERKQVEEQLRSSQRDLAEAQRVAKMGSWSWDAEKKSAHWSDEAYQIFGLDKETFNITRDTFAELIHPEDRSKVKQTSLETLRDGESFNIEYRVITPAGEVKTVSEVGYGVKDNDGKIISIFGLSQDITERKRAETERQALLEIMQGLANTKDLQELLRLVHHSIAKVIYAENFFVVLHQESTGLFEEIYSVDQYDPPAPPSKLENSITSYVFRSGEPLLLTQESFEELATRGKVKLVGTDSASWLGVPLKMSGRTIGVMAVQDYENDNRYSEREKEFLTSIATQVALVIERKRAEELLRESEERFSSAFEHAAIGMALVTTEGRWSRVNWALCWLLGYSQEELLQKTFQDITHPDDLENDLTCVRQLLAGEINSYQMEKRYFHKNGHIVWALLSASLVKDNQGKPLYFISQIQDITERKRVEESLREERKKAEKYLEIAGVMMLALDREGTVILINQKGCELLGYSADEIIGKNWIDTFLPSASREGLQEIYQTLFSDDIQGPEYYENAILTKSGDERLIAWHNTLLRDDQGKIISSLSSGEDITERKRAEQELHRRAQETSALLATSLALTSLDLEGTLQTIGNSASNLFLADGCRIFLMEPDGETLRCVLALQENTTAFSDLKVKLGEGVTGAVAASGRPEIVNKMQNDPRAVQVAGTDDEQEAIMFAPLKERDRTIGILSIRRLGEVRPFQPNDLELLEAFASMAASAVSKARLFEETQSRLSELHASEERFRQLADNIQEVFWMIDAETGREIYISPAVETIWGWSLQHMRHEHEAFVNSVFPEDQTLLLDAIEREKRGEKMQLEYRILRPDGSIRWVWDRAFPIFDESGKVTRIAGISADITDRRESELALAKSQNRYHELFDSSPISIWEEDFSLVKKEIDALQESGVTNLREYLSSHPEFVKELASLVKITDVNKASLELYGVDRKEDLLQNLGDILESTSLQHFMDEIIDLMSPVKRFSWEGTDRTFIGKTLEVLVNGSIPQGYEEDWSKVIVSIIDITERKEAAEKLRESEDRYHSLFQNQLHGSALHEIIPNEQGQPVDYIFLKVNPAFEKMIGLRAEQIVGQRVTEIFPGIENEKLIQIYRQVALTGKPAYLNEYFAPLGRYYEINAYATGTRRFAVSFMDVTERRQAEQELRKLSRAVEQSGSTIVITDTLGNIEYVNPKFTLITGYSAEEVIGQNPRILKSGFTSAEEYKQLWQTISAGREWHSELLNKKKDGTLYWESVTVSPILNDRGEITHYVGVKEDITERKQNEIETRRHIAELEAVYENGLSVGRLLEPSEIGNRVIETFARYLPWHHVTIRLKKEESDDLELVAFNLPNLKEEERLDTEQHFIARINKVGQGLSGWVIQTGISLRTGNVHLHPQYIDTHGGIQSGLYTPLRIGERVIGVISVESETPDAFTEQDERLLATLANQTAIAFENARLYEAMQKELSERKRVEDALRISETHYRALADSITDILFELDQNLHYTHWNKASEVLIGIPASQAIGKSMEEIIGVSEEQARIKMIYEDVLRRHLPKTFETTLVIGGENRSFEVNAYPSMRGVSVVAKDVTERKRTETILQKRFELMDFSAKHSLNELMQRAVDEVSDLTGSSIGFFHFMDDDQNKLGMQTWSTNALRLFQVSQAEGTHLALDEAGVWADAVRQRRPLIQNDYPSLAKKKGFPEGHVPILREMVIPIIRNERLMAVMGIGNKPQDYTQHDLEIAARLADYAWDVTERKQMEIALELERNQLVQRVEERTADLSRANSNLARALRVKDEFLANMSHELRTPLNAILGLSESLGEQIAGPLNEKQQKYISTISESGHHLLSLINDILDLAKIDAGQITMDINKVDIHSVCQASLRMIKQLAQKKNQEVSLEIDHGLGLMWADERRLKQMVVNLLGNAVKFTPENGKLGLEVHGDQEANQISITVWDNGIGIKEEDLARLFQPFVQLDSGLAREATGTGLGLALVAQMARLHGGSVNATSEAGKGSRFTILLPWEPALAMDAASRMRITGKFRAIQFDETNKPTILLVEDTKEVVMMLKDYLELAGYRVFTAQDGIDGLVQARHVRPDLILMDVQMPRMDGFETTRKLRSDPNFRYTPIIALTALAMPHDRERCLEAGMDEYISKPVNLKALIKIIQSCLFEQGLRDR